MHETISNIDSNTDLVEVKPSGIHGMGLFAKDNIPAGTNIMIISGDILDDDECVRREEEENNVYIFWNGDNNYIDTKDTSEIKYINHDCDPNCEVTERDSRTLYLTAVKNIEAGTELTIDYGYEEIYDTCSCTVCVKETNNLNT